VNNWKIIPTIVCATVLIFGAGVFTGGMLVDYVKQARPRLAGANKRPPATGPVAASVPSNAPPGQLARPIKPPEILSKDFLQRLDGEIHLTKEELEAGQKIINEGQNQMRKVVQDARLEFREVLTPDHRQQFDDLMKRPFHKPLFATNALPISAWRTNTPVESTNAP
jgi:uncharacterized membrane protein